VNTSASLRIWAKTQDETTSTFHPLLHHAIDIAATAAELLTKRFSPAKRSFADNLLFPANPENYRLLVFLAAIHDIGKATPPFQAKHEGLKKELESLGYDFSSVRTNGNKQRHNFHTEKWMRDHLADAARLKFENDSLRRIAKAVGGHHGVFSSARELQEITLRNMGASENWQNAKKEIVSILAELCEVKGWQQEIYINPDIPQLVLQYWLTGFITLADWISSMPEYFPYAHKDGVLPHTDPHKYFELSRHNASLALDACGFPEWKDPGALSSFSDLFYGYQPRKQQSEFLSALQQNLQNDPVLLIVEAPMGIGKTEMAFYGSELINNSEIQSGAYIGMPTMATSNQMYLRYRQFLETRLPANHASSLELLHSASELFLSTAAKPADISGIADEDHEDTAALVSYDWFRPKKRGLLSPFAVGTIDQVLISVLRTKHNYLRLYGLNGKTIILDEIHSYDVYMSELLSRFLAWASQLRISVILLSATLPKNKRMQLINAYAGSDILADALYPRLTIGRAGTVSSVPLTPPETKEIKLSRLQDDSLEEIAAKAADLASAGGCIAVICNTIDKAQKLFQHFRTHYDIPSQLLHSRFTAERRNEIEKDVLHYFGKNGSRPEKMVLFSTQIIEQSLDIDFDCMISELAPVDLLLQRLGRLQRFKDLSRSGSFREPSAFWFYNEDSSFSRTVYLGYILFRSYLSLTGTQIIRIPDGIEPLIEEVYGDSLHPAAGPDDIAKLDKLYKIFLEKQAEMQRKAADKLIPSPFDEDGLGSNVELFDDEDPSTHESLAALTRLGGLSVRVVCLLAENDQLFYALNEKIPFNENDQPDHRLAQIIMRASVPVSSVRLVRYILASPETAVPQSWKKNAMLRYMRIIVFTNGAHQTEFSTLLFDNDMGIIIKKSHEEEDESI